MRGDEGGEGGRRVRRVSLHCPALGVSKDTLWREESEEVRGDEGGDEGGE